MAEGGTPPRFLIIDDGWQQIGSENKEEANAVVQEGAQYAVVAYHQKFSLGNQHSFFSSINTGDRWDK